MKRFAIALLSTTLIAGCAGFADSMSSFAGQGVITQEKSTFNNEEVISVSPTFLHNEKNKWSGNSVKMGARWGSSTPESVVLVLSYDSSVSSSGSAYLSISSIELNIDGKISSYKATGGTDLSSGSYNTVTKTIYTSSKNNVVMPYSVLKAMVAAKDTRVRIHTSKGYEDSQFSVERIPGGQATAIVSMKEFINKVDLFQNKK